jgi:decaprenylphospho-beta-D-erythro-pentofuranosid-2-ulose 2-reductase
MKNVLILGATSAMARALARRVAGPEVRFVLAGLERKDLESTAADLELRGRGPRPVVLPFDAARPATHAAFWRTVLARVRTVDEVYLFFGLMHEQAAAQRDNRLAQDMIAVNYAGAVSVLELAAAYLEKRRSGLIAAVSSVAGDRGRQSNYLYGSAKAGLSVYLQGLRHRLAPAGVHVLTVKPGMVDTPMTRHLKKGPLFSQPDAIAKGIVRAVRRRRNEVYLPWYWGWIMAVIRALPEPVFKRLRL